MTQHPYIGLKALSTNTHESGVVAFIESGIEGSLDEGVESNTYVYLLQPDGTHKACLLYHLQLLEKPNWRRDEQ